MKWKWKLDTTSQGYIIDERKFAAGALTHEHILPLQVFYSVGMTTANVDHDSDLEIVAKIFGADGGLFPDNPYSEIWA